MARGLGHTLAVPWLTIQAGQDHLLKYSAQNPVDALAELIWNSLDAEADDIRVQIESAALGGNDQLATVVRVVVTDDGLGMTHERALQSFPSLGDSWKRGLNGRTPTGRWILHGLQGRGRFYAYALGRTAVWSSVAKDEGGQLKRIRIRGSSARVNGFDIDDPEPAAGETGTEVIIDADQERNLAALLAADLPAQLATRFAPHLLMHPEISLKVNDEAVVPAALMVGKPRDIPLTDVDASNLHGAETPVLTIVEWTPEMKNPLGLVLCSRGGACLRQVGRPVSGPVKATGYLKWSPFESSDLIIPDLAFPEVMEAARHQLDTFVRGRVEDLKASIVAVLKEEGSYPYKQDPAPSSVEAAERDMFDLVVVTARGALGANRTQRAMSARLLHLALQERPSELDRILEETLKLDPEQRQQLADMLTHSSLGSIVGAAAEVTRRVELLVALRDLLYGPPADRLREVDQLHPLVRDNAWVFGEDWRVSRSEAGLLTVLRDVLASDEIVLEADLESRLGSDLQDLAKRRRVDLVLQRSIRHAGQPKRLVVELKRPTTRLGNAELTQIKGYARLLANHPGGGLGAKWEFWLVGSATHPDIADDLTSTDRAWGHVVRQPTYDVYVTTWGELINEAESRLQFYKEQLGYDITQDDAVERVRKRHQELF